MTFPTPLERSEEVENWINLLDESHVRAVTPRPVSMGEVARYGRRSIKGEGGLAGVKSVSDQDAETLDMCEEFGLPTTSDDYYAEPPGLSGKAPYDGGRGRHEVHEEHKFDDKGRRRVRPRLTAMVKDIEEGRKRVVVAWSLCRLYRSVRLCEHLLDFFEEHDVELYDKDGRVDYRTPGGRESVVSKAVKYEAQRREAILGVTRGLNRNRKKGKIAATPNCLGMRTRGTRTNSVRFIDDEIRWVLRIFNLYLGIGSSRPLSTREIGKLLVDEGFVWPEDLRKKSEFRMVREPKSVTSNLIQAVLKNPRYVGYAPTQKGAYKCSAFLQDGKPVVPVDLFARAQRRLADERRVRGVRNTDRGLTSILVCGYDATPLQCQTPHVTLSGGRREKYGVWRTVPRESSPCDHLVPNLRDDVVMDYIASVLGEILVAELSGLAAPPDNDTRLAELRLNLIKLEADLENVERHAATSWRDDPMFAYKIKQGLIQRKRAIEQEVLAIDSHSESVESVMPAARSLSSEDPSVRAHAVRSILRWAAVVPSGKPKVRWANTGEPARNPDQGRVLFALPMGIYHTAVICFGDEHPRGYRKRINLLRPAEPHECLGSVGDLPYPKRFVEGLRDFRLRRSCDFDYAVDAVGYSEWLDQQFEGQSSSPPPKKDEQPSRE